MTTSWWTISHLYYQKRMWIICMTTIRSPKNSSRFMLQICAFVWTIKSLWTTQLLFIKSNWRWVFGFLWTHFSLKSFVSISLHSPNCIPIARGFWWLFTFSISATTSIQVLRSSPNCTNWIPKKWRNLVFSGKKRQTLFDWIPSFLKR